MTEEIRWHDRFRNFSRAFTLLREALEGEVEALSQLEREGVIRKIQRQYLVILAELYERLSLEALES